LIVINKNQRMKKYMIMILSIGFMGLSACSLDAPDVLTYEEQLAIFNAQLESDIVLIDQYLDENEIVAIEHESGIRYVTTLEGDGEVPVPTDVIKFKYEGRLFDDSIFDESLTKTPDWVIYSLNSLIASWQITIPLMKEGGKITIYAPSGYCYGTTGAGPIPPNTNLIFDIELVSIQ